MKYIRITRSDTPGGYVDLVKNTAGLVDAELDGIDYLDPGTSVTLTVVEMSEREYAELPEFTGW